MKRDFSNIAYSSSIEPLYSIAAADNQANLNVGPNMLAFSPSSPPAGYPTPQNVGAAPQGAPMQRQSLGHATHVGLVRDHNEDNLLIDPPLYAVCDGMGGHLAGEVASEIAVDTLRRLAPRSADADKLERAVEEANLAIIRAVGTGQGREGMGTTCTAAILDGERLAIAQVGDSRAYLLHAGNLQQLTRDHSLVADLVDSGEITQEEARTHPWRSYITRALGLDSRIQPDIFELNVSLGDRLMLCSDGLYAMVEDRDIERILAATPDAQNAADLLIEAALSHGGSDNITVIVVDANEFSPQKQVKIARKTKRLAAIIIALLVTLFIGFGVALNVITTNSAYLGEVDGRVAIYQGIPGEILGIGFSHLYEVTSVSMDDLQPGAQRRIEALDIRCDSLEEAQKLVGSYAQDIAGRAGSQDGTAGSGKGDAAPGSQPNADPAQNADSTPSAAGGGNS